LETYYFNFYDSKSVPNGQEKLLVNSVLKIDFLNAYDDLLRLQHVRPACDPDKKSAQTGNIRNTMDFHEKFAMTADVVLVNAL